MKMKRLFSLILTMLFLLSIVSLSFGAVTVGGNLRIWYQAAEDETLAASSTNHTFRFDYLALTANADLSPASGISSEIRFYQVDKNTVSTSGTPSGSTDIRLITTYYYQKDVFSQGDELDLGYIKLPFYNESYKGIFVGSLAYNARPKNDVGISYTGKINTFTYTLAVANAANQANYNSPPASEGVDSVIRFSYVPVQQLKIGLGYSNDVTDSNNSTARLVFDTTYGIGPFGIFAEYVSVTPQSKDALTGIYFESSYQISEPVTIYAGRAVSTSDDDNSGAKLTNSVGAFVPGGPGGKSLNLTDDWTLLGVKYQLTPKTALQGEVLQQDSDSAKTKQIIGLRALFNF
jgi:hypothetical protein